LPELLGIPPESFNNSRLHRVLDDLDNVTTALQAKLPVRYVANEGDFTSLFMDVSDAWFVGEGPTMARRGKTKEGMLERKIGIVLLCNEHGYPLRWEVVEGTLNDSVAMSQMFAQIAGVSWARQAPVVCDRAMGHTAQIRHMLGTKLRFLTALNVCEFDSYATRIPHQPFANLAASADEQAVARCAEDNGMRRVRDNQLVIDLGIVQRDEGSAQPTHASRVEDVTVTAMRICREIREAVAQGRYASLSAAGRSVGLRKTVTIKYCSLAALSEQQQRDVLDGKVCTSLARVLRVAAIKDAVQRDEAFDALLQLPPSKTTAPKRPACAAPAVDAPITPIRVRVVAYFNPERFVAERRRAREQLRAIDTFVSELNTRGKAPRSRLTPHAVAVLVDQRLRKDALLNAFRVHIDNRPNQPLRVDLVLDEAEWARRRRYDGFTVLVAHPDLPHSAEELSKLYRAKDAVEKDFHVIKSVVEVRPIRHRNDAKVRAHVTLCMLALLLERTLSRRLVRHPDSAETALETLASCHLNLFKGEHGPAAYAITHTDDEQRAILRALRMLGLADDDHLAEKISPR
jgi:hypothetical protein